MFTKTFTDYKLSVSLRKTTRAASASTKMPLRHCVSKKGHFKCRSAESLTQSTAPRCRRARRFCNGASATNIPEESFKSFTAY
jgi:hypothetical protein